MKKRSSVLLALLVCLALASTSTSAFASHLRGTSISWSPTSTPGQVQFTIQYSQRASAGCSSGSCVVGATMLVPFSYGDGATANVTTTVTSVNSAEDYFSSTGTITHTYAGAGPYTAFYSVCCRVSTIVSGHDQTLRMETTVSPLASPANHSPVVSMPAIITIPLQATTGFFITASDLDRDTLSYRLATAAEMYSASPFNCAYQQPPGLSVNSSTGQVSWDTTQIQAAGCGFAAPQSGDLWTAQFMVQDLDASSNVKSKVPLDVILKFVSSTEAPPTLALSNPGPFTIQAGNPVTFTASANDAAANSRVTLNATGLPIGATVTNTNQALAPPLSSTFSWTPTPAQGGSYVITYTATNDTFEQTLASVTIYVQNLQPPVLTCPAPLSAQYNLPLAIPLQVSDPQGDALSVVWSIDGTPVHSDSLSASSSTTSLSLTQTFTSVGAHALSVTATNTDQLASTCSTAITVSPAAQSINFPALGSITYGDPDVTPLAIASSGLAVTYSATGGCSILNGAVHANAAGACSVTANQPGNTGYNASAPVVQQINIASRTLTATAGNATRSYGAANPVFSGTLTGITGTDAITAIYASAATPTSAVGPYPIVPTLSGAALANYAVTANNGVLTITKALASVTANPAAKVYGTADPTLSGTLSGFLPADGVSATYSRVAGESVGSSPYVISATLNPVAALSNYTVTINPAAFTISKATPVVTWANPAAINYGQLLSSTQLNATASVAGSFLYTPAAGALLSGGSQSLSATFTPTDAINYSAVTSHVALLVNASTVTLGISGGTQTYPFWTNFVLGPTYSGSRVPTGTVTLFNNGVPLVTLQLGGDGRAYYTQPPLNVGANNLTVSYSGDGFFPAGLSAVTLITVNPAPVNFQASCWGAQVYSNNSPFQCTVNLSASTSTPPIGNITYSLDGAPAVPVAINGGNAPFAIPGTLSAGNHIVVLTYAGAGNYAAAQPLTRTFTTQPGQTQLQVSPSGYYVASGSSFTLTASATTPNSGPPAGSISFYDNGQLLGSVATNASGTAAFNLPHISKGSHTFNAVFAASTNYQAASSGSSGVTAY